MNRLKKITAVVIAAVIFILTIPTASVTGWESPEPLVTPAEEYSEQTDEPITTSEPEATEEPNSPYEDTVAALFSDQRSYKIGEYCIYDGSLYRFIISHPAGAWDDSHVIKTALADDVALIKERESFFERMMFDLVENYGDEILLGNPVISGYDNSAALHIDNNGFEYTSAAVNTNRWIGFPMMEILGGKNVDIEVTVSDPSLLKNVLVTAFTSQTGQGYTIATLERNGNKYTITNRKISPTTEYYLLFFVQNNTQSFDASVNIYEYGAEDRIKEGIISEQNLTNELKTQFGLSPVRYTAEPRFANAVISPDIQVGDVFSTKTNSYVNLHEIPVPEGCKGVFVECGRYVSASHWCVVDDNNRILALSGAAGVNESKSIGDYIDLTGLDAPAKVYTAVIQTAVYSVAFFDYDKTSPDIYPGDINIGVVNGASPTGNTEKSMPVYYSDGTEAISVSVGNLKARSLGIWIKVPDRKDIDKLSYMYVRCYKDTTPVSNTTRMDVHAFQMSDWVFVKLYCNDKIINRIVLTPTLAGSETVSILVLGGIISDHFSRPTAVFDFDSAWRATEVCGAYDLLINNGVPFTITGSLDSAGNDIKEKLLHAYDMGLLDVGFYGAEISGQTVDINANYSTLINRIHAAIDHKLNICCVPTSFGPGNHYASPRLWRALKECGFTAIKGGATNLVEGSAVCEDPGVLLLSGNPEYAMSVGGNTVMFWHGISIDPSSESNPSLYGSYSVFSSHVNKAVDFRSRGGMLILNMKQYAEYMEGKR